MRSEKTSYEPEPVLKITKPVKFKIPAVDLNVNARRDARGVHEHRPRRAARGPRQHERGAARPPQLRTHAARVRGAGGRARARAGRLARPGDRRLHAERFGAAV